MPTTNPEDFWRKTINKMVNELPEDGKDSPEVESIKPPTPRVRKVSDGARKVMVHKIITSIYVMTDVKGKMYTSHAHQNMHILGEMTLEQALKIAQQDDSI